MKLLYTTLLLAGLSLTSLAQTITGELAADYERAKAFTLQYLEAMPEDKFTYKISEETMTYAEQMLHIAQATAGLVSNASGGEALFTENLQKNEAYHTKEEAKRLVTEAFDYAIKEIKGMNDANLSEVVARGKFEVTRLGWVNKAYEHLVHHRGQCAAYLRSSGITPPQYQLF